MVSKNAPTRFMVNLPDEHREKIRELSSALGITQSDLAVAAIAASLSDMDRLFAALSPKHQAQVKKVRDSAYKLNSLLNKEESNEF